MASSWRGSDDQEPFWEALQFDRSNWPVTWYGNIGRHEHPRRHPNFPSEERLKKAGQYEFLSSDDDRPLCQWCKSISFVDLMSTEGYLLQSSGSALQKEYTSSRGCPLCFTIWQALLDYVDKTYADTPKEESPYDDYKTKDQRLTALIRDPVKLFLNPLCPKHEDTAGKSPDDQVLTYQMRELWVWSASMEILDKIELRHNWYDKEWNYQRPALQRSIKRLSYVPARPGEKVRLDRALTCSRIIPKTAWCKSNIQ